jgi:hypothetical protein
VGDLIEEVGWEFWDAATSSNLEVTAGNQLVSRRESAIADLRAVYCFVSCEPKRRQGIVDSHDCAEIHVDVGSHFVISMELCLAYQLA